MPNVYNDIKQTYYAEIQEKKISSYGAYAKRGKGVKHGIGKIYFASDLLRGKEKKKYKKSGKVKVYNMFTSLMTYEDLKTHPKERQTEILTKWRETYSENEIIESLGVEEEVYHQLLADLGLEKKEMKKKRTFPNSRPDADPKQVIPFNDLKKLPKKDQWFLISEYTEKWNAQSLAKIWGKRDSAVHNFKHNLKKLALKNGWIDEYKKDKAQGNIQVLTPAVEESKQEQVGNAGDERVEQLMSEFKEMKTLINTLLSSNNQVAVAETEKISEPDVLGNGENNDKPESFTMNYENETEGFVIFQDLKRFIAVLEKNPDRFKVEVKLTRIEE